MVQHQRLFIVPYGFECEARRHARRRQRLAQILLELWRLELLLLARVHSRQV